MKPQGFCLLILFTILFFMKRILLFASFCTILLNNSINGQCPVAGTLYGSGTAPTTSCTSVQASPTCHYTSSASGDYARFNTLVGGSTYTIISSATSGSLVPNTDELTIYLSTDLITGNHVAYGTGGMVTFTPAVSGDYIVIINKAGAACGTAESVCRYISIQCTSCAPPASTTTQPLTTNVTAGTVNNQILRLNANACGQTITSITFSTNGSTDPANDITNAKVYYTTTTTFSTTTQYGSTVTNPNGSFTVNGSQSIGTTGYFWLTYDLKCGATGGNVVDGECTSYEASGSGTVTPSPTNPSGTRTITASSTTAATIQPTTNVIAIPSNNNQVLRVDVTTCANSTVTDLNLATTGSTNPSTDISNAKVYFTTTTTFSTATQFGSTVSNPNGTFTVSGSQVLTTGTGYFWITYDVPGGATAGNVVDAECTSATINGSSYVPATTNPAGTRQLVTPPANDECSGAIALTVNADLACGTTTSANTANATQSTETSPSCSATGIDDDIWYSFTATGPKHTLVLSGASVQMTMAVYSGNCGALTQISGACANTSSGTATLNFTGLTAGTNYKVRIFTTATSGNGTVTLCVGTPVGTSCSDAVQITSLPFSSGTQTTCGSGDDYPAGSFCNTNYGGGEDYVYALTINNAPISVNFALGGSATYKIASLHSACPPTSGNCLIGFTTSSGTTASGCYQFSTNGTYYIYIDTWPSPTCGQFTLDLTTSSKPANDNCSGATSLTVNADQACGVTTAGNTAGATQSTETAPTCNATGVDDDIWYSFTATATSHEVKITGATNVTGFAVYSGSCGSLSQLSGACGTTSSGTGTLNASGLTIGIVYYVRVFSTATTCATTTSFNVCIGTYPACPAPSSLTAGTITGTSAILNWTENGSATTWDISYGVAPLADPNTGTIISGTSTKPYTLSGLNGETTYDFYVRAICGGTPSAWSSKATFTTLFDCATSTVLTCGGSVTTGNLAVAGGIWTFPGTFPNNSCGFSTPGKEKVYRFTPTTSGTHAINITSVNSGTGYIDYFFKAGGACSNTGWTCIKDLSAVSSTSFGPLTAGVEYYILLDAESAASTANHTFNITCPANMAYVSSTVGAQTSTAVGAGTVNADIVRLDVVVSGQANPLSVTSFTCNTNGSTSPVTNNVSTGKVYYTGTSTTFSTTTLVGSVAIAADGSFTITGNQALTGGLSNTTNYFWLAYDIKCGAVNTNVVDGEFNSITVGGTPYTPTVQAPALNRAITGFTVATNQPLTTSVGAGASDAQVLRIDVTGGASCGNLTQVVAATTGTTNVADLSRAKLYYTGTSSTFSNTTQFGATINNPNGTMTFDGSQVLATGTNYFWLVYDISCSATNGNVIDAALTNVAYNGTLTPATPNPTGTRTLTALASYDTKADGNWNDVNTWACSVPPSGTSIPININHNVSFNQDHTQNAGFTVATGKTLTLGTNALTINSAASALAVNLNGTVNINGTGSLTINPTGAGVLTTTIAGSTTVSGTGVMNVGSSIGGTGTASVTVSSGGSLNVSGGTLNIGTAAVSGTASNLTISSGGTFAVSSGTANIGPSGGFLRTLSSSGTFTVSGGTLNVNGNVTIAAGSFSMSNGNFNIDGNTGTTTTSVAAGTHLLSISVSSFAMSGGTLTIVDPNIGSTGNAINYSNASSCNLAGGTISLGDGTSSTSGGAIAFNLNTWASSARLAFNNLTVNGGNGTNRFLQTTYSFGVLGDLTIGTNSELRTSSQLYVRKNFNNNGTFSYSGNLTFADFTGGTQTASTFAQTVSGSGTYKNVTTGSATAMFATMTVNNTNTNGVVLEITNPTISSSLTLTAGILRINSTNDGLLTVGLSTTTPGTVTQTITSANVVGKLKRWRTNATGSLLFPIGSTTTNYNATINYTVAPSAGGSLTAQFISGDAGSAGLPLTDAGGTKIYANTLCTTGYWQIDAGDGLTGGTYTGNFNATGFSCIDDFANARLIKRVNGSGNNWTLNGTYAAGTGSNSSPVVNRTGMSGFSQFAVSQGQLNPLPVELTTFKGEARQKANMLTWETASEINSDEFIVERAPEAEDELFNAIGTVDAKGNTTGTSKYDFMDDQPLPVSYYRLKIIDNDGSYEYSKIIVLQNNNVGTGHVNVYPVPAHNAVTFAFQCERSDDVNVTITDFSGRVVKQFTINASKGLNQKEVNIEDLPVGMYHAQIIGADINSNVRIIRN